MNLLQVFPVWISVLLVLLSTSLSRAYISKGDLPQELQACYNSFSHLSLRDVVGQSVCWACEEPVIRRLRTAARTGGPTNTPSAIAYVNRLLRKLSDRLFGDFDIPVGFKCRRREYRMLSDNDRERFHRAINFLKDDTTVQPNKYDAIARLHFGEIIGMAHYGPPFLGWHRLYLLLLELALQEVDPNICLPYWDSSLDNELDDPSSSYVFSSDFLGGGKGNATVSDGPFAGWVTPYFGPLIRNIGANGQLFSVTAIRNILNQTRTRDVTPPVGKPQNGIEFHHNGVHVYIGGQMNELDSAAHDPVFFLHHAFVDYVWEVFRNKQRSIGVDPQYDYPKNFGRLVHAPDNIIGIYSLNITSRQAYSNKVMDSYEYEPSPTCNRYRPDCRSKYLRCNVDIGRCIPVDPKHPELSTIGRGCRSRRGPRAIQNNFCIDGVCDMKKWVYVPVKVVSMRSPDLHGYSSFPVVNGTIFTASDIYQPSAYRETAQIAKQPPMSYEKCDHGDGMGQIFIQSNGLNYDGYYKESVIIDQRLATSIAVGYIAVKDPINGTVTALFRAFDSCGRICNTAFKELGTRNFESFSGVLHISDIPGVPKQYSKTYGQATLNTWGFSQNQDCPSFTDDSIALTFYCDYKDTMPWARKLQPQGPLGQKSQAGPSGPFYHGRRFNGRFANNSPSNNRQIQSPLGNLANHQAQFRRNPYLNQYHKHGRYTIGHGSQVGPSGIPPVHQHFQRGPLSPSSQHVSPLHKAQQGRNFNNVRGQSQQHIGHVSSHGCTLSAQCTVGVSCEVAARMCGHIKYQCQSSCNSYAVCGYAGHYIVKTCPNNWAFNSRSGHCDRTQHCARASPEKRNHQYQFAAAAYYIK